MVDRLVETVVVEEELVVVLVLEMVEPVHKDTTGETKHSPRLFMLVVEEEWVHLDTHALTTVVWMEELVNHIPFSEHTSIVLVEREDVVL